MKGNINFTIKHLLQETIIQKKRQYPIIAESIYRLST